MVRHFVPFSVRLGMTIGAVACIEATSQHASAPPTTPLAIAVEATPVPLDPQHPSATTLGEFRYAGGLALRSQQSDLLHELSDLVITGRDRFAAVGDGGVLVEGRLLFDEADRLVGVADTTVMPLIGENGEPLTGASVDAEGLALLPTGDRLISFEKRPRIWLYPETGGPPRPVPSPQVRFRSNAGMEALTAEPEAGADAYTVGDEDSGATWTCRVTSACIRGPTVKKPREFGLVSMNRLGEGMMAYLLRAYDPVRRSRVTLMILRDTTVIARMDLAPPMTVDNFEGMTSVLRDDGRRRFYLISDDNNRRSQRTLLFAFDWPAPPSMVSSRSRSVKAIIDMEQPWRRRRAALALCAALTLAPDRRTRPATVDEPMGGNLEA